MKEIIHHHYHFNTQPFFQWDLKLLPFIVDWFARTKTLKNEHSDDEAGYEDLGPDIDTRNLSVLFQLTRGMQ